MVSITGVRVEVPATGQTLYEVLLSHIQTLKYVLPYGIKTLIVQNLINQSKSYNIHLPNMMIICRKKKEHLGDNDEDLIQLCLTF